MVRILLTSFQTWLPHQSSNSSDDLIDYLDRRSTLSIETHLLRRIPVDFHIASRQVISKIQEIQPELILCCGMAEPRSKLSIESNGRFQSHLYFTSINLDALIDCTAATVISHNAGRFVCNYLYYQVLRYLDTHQSPAQCLFIHVPLLNSDNLPVVADDFLAILKQLAKMH
jgi:pyroglutamyl-peptidase